MLNEISYDIHTPTLKRVISKEMRKVLDQESASQADALFEEFPKQDSAALRKRLIEKFEFVCQIVYITAREQTLIQVEEYLKNRSPDFDTLYEEVLPEKE